MSDDRAEFSIRPEQNLNETLLAQAPIVARLRGRNATKADVIVHEIAGRRIAVKDFGARPLWVRLTIGRWSIAREAAAYRAVEGLSGLPRFHGRIGRYALALDWIDAKPLADLGGTRLPASVFSTLDAIIAAIHRRGVALGDLHHRDVLVAHDGAVHVIDLATAWVIGSAPSRWRRGVFEKLSGNDLVAAARLRARFTGISEEEALASVPADAIRRHRRARIWKTRWDWLRGKE